MASLALHAQLVRQWTFTDWSNTNALISDENWSDIEKADATEPTELSKEKCFWEVATQGTNEGATVKANGSAVKELEGLLYTNPKTNRSLAIAVDYQTVDESKDFGPYHGKSYLWLGSKNINYFVIPGVKPGSTITIGEESHKTTDKRGVNLYIGRGTDNAEPAGTKLKDPQGQEVAMPTTYVEQQWLVPADASDAKNADGTFDITIRNTNGCHLYFIKVEAPVNKDDLTAVVSMKSKVEEGAERTLTFGTYLTSDTYAVDWGDGELVLTDLINKTNSKLTSIKGEAKGTGNITVYADNDSVWYFATSGGAQLESIDLSKLKSVQQMNVTGVGLETIDVTACDSLRQLTFNNNPTKSIDLSKNPELTSLTINNTSASKYESQLESIDVSKNPKLTYLSLQGSNGGYGKLTTVDLTANEKLENVYLQYNALTDIKMPASCAALTTFNAQNNQLTAFDATKTPAMKTLYLADNKLTTIDPSQCANMTWLDVKNNQLEGDLDLTANQKFANVYVNGNKLTSVKVSNVTKQFYFDNNQMTLATMPAKPAGLNTASKTKQFHYAPQAAIQVDATVGVLDLSAQATATGILEAPVATTFSFVTASGTALVAGTDYQEIDKAKFAFIKEQTEKVHGVLATEAFPLFADANALVTTEFTVDANAGLTSINGISIQQQAAKTFNLQGQQVEQPTKGLYIQNGKKILVK